MDPFGLCSNADKPHSDHQHQCKNPFAYDMGHLSNLLGEWVAASFRSDCKEGPGCEVWINPGALAIATGLEMALQNLVNAPFNRAPVPLLGPNDLIGMANFYTGNLFDFLYNPPEPCGGGVFGFATKGGTLNGGGIVNIDSREGFSAGFLGEATGEVGGVGIAAGTKGIETFAFTPVFKSSRGVEAGALAVITPSFALCGYVEGTRGKFAGGGGASTFSHTAMNSVLMMAAS